MSWEEIKRKEIDCPCGKGKIVQSIYGDDWNRIEKSHPIINCKFCITKYKIKAKTHYRLLASDGYWTEYYLLPIDYPDYNGITESKFFEVTNNNVFYCILIESYSLESLRCAIKEYKEKKFSSHVTGIAKDICKKYKNRFKSTKSERVILEIEKAILNYKNYNGTYEQRIVIREKEKQERNKYNIEEEKYKINLNF